MNEQGFTTTFSVDRTPDEVFAAINDPRRWWSEEIDGSTDTAGAEFTYHYEDVHRTRFRVTELVPGQEVSWLVLDNYFAFTRDETEWTGTTIRFRISRHDDRTEVRFTHVGLVREYECFEVCTNSWGFYINGSLRNLITTGEGQPNGRGRPRVPAEEELTSGRGR